MIIVTGGAGFIGSNLVEGLNARGEANILVVDHLKNGEKMRNLADLEIAIGIHRAVDRNLTRAIEPVCGQRTNNGLTFCAKLRVDGRRYGDIAVE